MTHATSLLIAASILCAASGAMAQTTTPPPANDQSSPTHFDSQARKNETLTERLDRTDGVIRPPAHVDPEMAERPPPTGDRNIVPPSPSPPGIDPTAKPR